MAAHVSNTVDLGFVEENDPQLLKSHFFPSKVGGKPAWLCSLNLPSQDSILCSKCKCPCIFLLQVYSPREIARAFHRTVFIFLCRNPSCCSNNSPDNFKVYRSQLAKENDFYSSNPPDEKNPTADPCLKKVGVALCVVCGSGAPKRCGKCHTASYCSKEHQTADWKANHKKKCGQEKYEHGSHTEFCISMNWNIANIPSILFPEMELVMEVEDWPQNAENAEKSEEDKMAEYREYLGKIGDRVVGEQAALSKEELEKSAVMESEDDKQFSRFKARIASNPDQVLRYDRGGEPLWLAAQHKPSAGDIPACPCGAPREFEFQVLPQLLSHLKVDSLGDSIDWGTLCVYTCSNSCDIGNNYQEEFLWKQDITGGKRDS